MWIRFSIYGESLKNLHVFVSSCEFNQATLVAVKVDKSNDCIFFETYWLVPHWIEAEVSWINKLLSLATFDVENNCVFCAPIRIWSAKDDDFILTKWSHYSALPWRDHLIWQLDELPETVLDVRRIKVSQPFNRILELAWKAAKDIEIVSEGNCTCTRSTLTKGRHVFPLLRWDRVALYVPLV